MTAPGRWSLHRAGALGWLLVSALAGADTGVNDITLDKPFLVKAAIVNGCVLGSGGADVTTFGTIDFGQVSLLPAAVNVTSTTGAGSIELQCTPGTTVTIGIDAGLNASNIAAGRVLIKGAESLRYQLYQDSGTTLWGNGTNDGTAKSVAFPATPSTVSYPIYARLFAVTPMPSAGIYSDTVTVTITY